jgi:phenylacetate-CoA ligase
MKVIQGPWSTMSPHAAFPYHWPLTASLDAVRRTQAALDVWHGTQLNPALLALQQQRRLSALLRYARERSPFYRSLHAGLPVDGPTPLKEFPSVTKRALMSEFDRVSTRPDVNLRAVRAFVSDPDRLGTLLNGKYAVWTSSGTTGEPGYFVHDAEALAVYDALESQRFRGLGFGPGCVPAWSVGERYAMLAATGGHFAGVASLERLRRSMPWLAPFVQSFSLLQPVGTMVDQLNAFAPKVLATYPTAAAMLADEQEAGRLHLRLTELWTGGECLGPGARERLQSAFKCRIRNAYGASEFLPIAWECAHGKMHVNSDWVILEPVDAQGRCVEPGTQSHSVLLTNLANRVQPLIRYELGDSVTLDPTRCGCGSALPVVSVEGRCSDTLMMPLARGGTCAVVPLALETILEERAHVHDYQVVQTAPSTLKIRLGADAADSGAAVRRALRAYFRAMGFADVSLQVADDPPARDRASGKLRRVVREVEPASR